MVRSGQEPIEDTSTGYQCTDSSMLTEQSWDWKKKAEKLGKKESQQEGNKIKSERVSRRQIGRPKKK